MTRHVSYFGKARAVSTERGEYAAYAPRPLRRWQYVGPATMSRILQSNLQPDKKTGQAQASEASMLVCSMQALSCVATRRHAHKDSPRSGPVQHIVSNQQPTLFDLADRPDLHRRRKLSSRVGIR